jgi:hypothetical protein
MQLLSNMPAVVADNGTQVGVGDGDEVGNRNSVLKQDVEEAKKRGDKLV